MLRWIVVRVAVVILALWELIVGRSRLRFERRGRLRTVVKLASAFGIWPNRQACPDDWMADHRAPAIESRDSTRTSWFLALTGPI